MSPLVPFTPSSVDQLLQTERNEESRAAFLSSLPIKSSPFHLRVAACSMVSNCFRDTIPCASNIVTVKVHVKQILFTFLAQDAFRKINNLHHTKLVLGR